MVYVVNIETDKAPSTRNHAQASLILHGYGHAEVITSNIDGRKPGEERVSFPDPVSQTEQIFKNITAILEDANFTLDNVVKVELSITDRNHDDDVEKVYNRYFTEPPYPTRKFPVVKELRHNASVVSSVRAFKWGPISEKYVDKLGINKERYYAHHKNLEEL